MLETFLNRFQFRVLIRVATQVSRVIFSTKQLTLLVLACPRLLGQHLRVSRPNLSWGHFRVLNINRKLCTLSLRTISWLVLTSETPRVMKSGSTAKSSVRRMSAKMTKSKRKTTTPRSAGFARVTHRRRTSRKLLGSFGWQLKLVTN